MSRPAANPTATPPAPAPSASRPLAYVQAGDIWTADPARPNAPRQLTRRGDIRDIIWAPNGRKIAFTAGSRNDSEIYVHDLTDGQEKRLTTNRLFDGQPDWSSDSRLLVFTRGNLSGIDDQWAGRAIEGEIWRMDADGQNARRLTVGRSPVWAPDGRRIAFVTNGQPAPPAEFRTANELHLINAEGQNEWALLRLAALPEEIDLSGVGAIFRPGPELFDEPVWTGGGRAIAATVWGAIPLIVSITDQAQNLTVVAASHEGGVEHLRGQPGGRLLAYTVLSPSGVPFVEIAPYDQRVSNQSGRVQIGGPRAGETVGTPAWASNGESLAVLTGPAEEKTIARYSPAGQKSGTLGSGQISALAW